MRSDVLDWRVAQCGASRSKWGFSYGLVPPTQCIADAVMSPRARELEQAAWRMDPRFQRADERVWCEESGVLYLPGVGGGQLSAEHLLDDVRDVNLSYLLLMQRLINTDRELAMFRLKIDEDMADLLSEIPVADLAKLARCNQLLCHFSLDDADQLFSLINAPRDDDMRRLHAAILLSSQRKRKSDRRQGDRRSAADRRTVAAGNSDTAGTERRQVGRRKADRKPKG